MKNVFRILMFLAVCSSVMAFSYSVSGKVYNSITGTAVPNAAITHETEYVAGSNVWSGSTQYTANDGSFTFSVNSSIDPKGKNMRLKAAKDFMAGSTTWVCTWYSENKDVWMSSMILLNPNLSVAISPANFAHPGPLKPVTTVAYLDHPEPPVAVTGFRTVIAYDASKMNCTIMASPDSFFDIFMESIGPGTVTVRGTSRIPSVLITYEMPQSFFDIFIEVASPGPLPEVMFLNASVKETTELYTMGPQPLNTYLHRTEFQVGQPEGPCQPYLLIDNQPQWKAVLESEWPKSSVTGLTIAEWDAYFGQLQMNFAEGQPYPPTHFMPPELYVYGGGGGGGMQPEDAGLVMKWGDATTPDGEYASAWKYDYGLDPDLSNSLITVQVTPPAPSGITQISLGMKDVGGNIRSWWWNVPAPIPHNIPTTVTINTAMTGIGATTPPASGYASNPAFNIAMVQQIVADENAVWVASSGVPAPGQQVPGLWNYWHNLSVTPKPPAGGPNSKWYTKYSQPPVEIAPYKIYGWDEVSIYDHQPYPIMADDWPCKDERPITDIHWWGSFKGWTQPHLPPILPIAFRIGIWKDVPAGIDRPFSHPGELIWENVCTSAVWNFAGYDVDPHCGNPLYECQENETCFQWAQFLSQDQWFRQEPRPDGLPNIYWLSIAAVYGPNTDFASPDFYPWGWKTRKHTFMDDAIRIHDASIWPPVIGAVWTGGMPVQFPQEISWDLAFELTTNEPSYADNPIPGDITGPAGVPDKIVDLRDFALMASHWLETAP